MAHKEEDFSFPDPPSPIRDYSQLSKGERMFQLRKIKAGNPEESKASVDNGFVKENGLQTEENDVFTQEEIYIEEPDIEEPDIEDNSNVTEMDSPNNFADEMLEVKSENVDDELENLVRSGSVGGLLSTDFRAVLENSIAGPPMSSPVLPTPEMTAGESTGERLDRAAAARAAAAADQEDHQLNGQFDISDVDELIKRRLVSEALLGSFRKVLEHHIEDVDVRRPADFQFYDLRRETTGPFTS